MFLRHLLLKKKHYFLFRLIGLNTSFKTDETLHQTRFSYRVKTNRVYSKTRENENRVNSKIRVNENYVL